MRKYLWLLILLFFKNLTANGRNLEARDDPKLQLTDNIINLLGPFHLSQNLPSKVRVTRNAPPSWMIHPPQPHNSDNQHWSWNNQPNIPSWMHNRPIADQPQAPTQQNQNNNAVQQFPNTVQNPNRQFPTHNLQPPLIQNPQVVPEIISSTQNPWMQTELPLATLPPIIVPNQPVPITNPPITTPPQWLAQPEKPSVNDEAEHPWTTSEAQTTHSIITAPVIRRSSTNPPHIWMSQPTAAPWLPQQTQDPQQIRSIVTSHPLITAPVIRKPQRPSVNQAQQRPNIPTPPPIIQGTEAPSITAPARPPINLQTQTTRADSHLTAPVITRQRTTSPTTAPRFPTTLTPARPVVTTSMPVTTPNRPLITGTVSPQLVTTTRQLPATTRQPVTPVRPQTTTLRPVVTTRPTTVAVRLPVTTRSPTVTRQPATTTLNPTRRTSPEPIKEQPPRNQQSLNDIMKMTENIFSTLNNHILQSLGQFGRK